MKVYRFVIVGLFLVSVVSTAFLANAASSKQVTAQINRLSSQNARQRSEAAYRLGKMGTDADEAVDKTADSL